MKKICILDYGLGNIRSLYNAIKVINSEVNYYSEIKNKNFDILFIPGVGSFNKASKIFKDQGYLKIIKKANSESVKIIGICLGMHILFSEGFEDGRNFDRIAATKNEEADSLYNKSAKILSDCDLLIKGNPYMINEVERMQNIALSIQNYIKAGNLIQASLNLKDYKNTFEKDLIYTDGSSFIENIETILNHSAPTISGKFALTNNNRVIRSELKRINYWSKN